MNAVHLTVKMKRDTDDLSYQEVAVHVPHAGPEMINASDPQVPFLAVSQQFHEMSICLLSIPARV